MLSRWVVASLLWLVLHCRQLQLNLKQTQATLYSNNQVVLKFNVDGGQGKKKFQFLGIPSNWLQNRNDLVISNFTLGEKKEWSFEVYIEDDGKNFLRQTIKLVFEGFNVELLPITLPLTGNLNDPKTKQKATQEAFNIKSLIQQYPGIKQSEFGLDYDKNVEITPYLIANAKATYNPQRDGKIVSRSQIIRNAAIQRQINADKAIANLLQIIQQLTANINKIAEDIRKYEKDVKGKKDDLFYCQEDHFRLENIKAKILNAVDDKKVKMNQYQNQVKVNEQKLTSLTNQLLQFKKNRFQIEKRVTPNNIELEKLQKTLNECDNILDKDKDRIQDIVKNINENNAQIGLLQAEIQESKSRIKVLSQDLKKVRNKIDDLKKQLAEAQSEEKQIVKELSYYKQIPTSGQRTITKLKMTNNNYERVINTINQRLQNQVNDCQKADDKIEEIRASMIKSRVSYQKLARSIADKENQIKDVKEIIVFFKENTAKIPIELTALETQLHKYQERIKRQIFICGVTQEDLQRAEINLEAMRKKYQDDSKGLKTAEANLEKARVEKEIADLAVNQILGTTGALPFPSAFSSPSSKSQYPIVSKLGTNFKVGTKSNPNKAVNVTDINQYIKRSFDLSSNMNAKPVLYPIDKDSRKRIVSSISIYAGLSSFSCQSQRVSYVGKIQRVSLGTVQIRDKWGKYFSASLSKCTIISSTSPQVFFTRGTTVYFSGKQLFGLPGTTLFDAYELLLIPN